MTSYTPARTYPYPDQPDPLRDGYAAMRELALALDLDMAPVAASGLSSNESSAGGANTKAGAAANELGTGIGTGNVIGGGGTTIAPNKILGFNTAGLNLIAGGYDNLINTGDVGAPRAGANTIGGGAHHQIIGALTSHGSIGGGSYNKITNGDYGRIGGGTLNLISAGLAFIGGGDNNKVSGTNGAIVGGKNNNVTGTYGTASGLDNTVSGANGAQAHGRGNSSVGNNSTTWGAFNVAEGTYSTAHGQQAHARTSGQRAFSAAAFVTPGDAQGADYSAKIETTTAATTVLQPGIILPPDSLVVVSALVTGRGSDGNATAFEVKGLAQRVGSAAVTIVGAITSTPIGGSAGAAAWAASLVPGASTVSVRVNGAAGVTIRWHATGRTSEVVAS